MWRFLVMCKIWSENELPALKIMFTPDHYLLWLILHYILLVHILQSIYSIHVLVLNITWHRTKWTKNAENASYNTCQNKFFGYVPNFTTDWASNITREFPSSCPVVQLSNCPGFLSSHLECEAFMNWMQVTAPSLLYSFYLYITFLTRLPNRIQCVQKVSFLVKILQTSPTLIQFFSIVCDDRDGDRVEGICLTFNSFTVWVYVENSLHNSGFTYTIHTEIILSSRLAKRWFKLILISKQFNLLINLILFIYFNYQIHC